MHKTEDPHEKALFMNLPRILWKPFTLRRKGKSTLNLTSLWTNLGMAMPIPPEMMLLRFH
jgi:hypothetical protein